MKKPVVLIVEKDPKIQNQLEELFKRKDVDIIKIDSVQRFNDYITSGEKELKMAFISDDITEHDGYKLMNTLKKYNPETHIIYHTNIHSEKLERKVRQSGILFYTKKPLDYGIIKKFINKIFENNCLN